jgi:hypothetical protein
MFIGFFMLITALAISAIAIYYSVAGLAAIFAAAVVPIVIMGSALEIGKLVTAVWLHKYWSRATWWLRTYLTTAVLVLMFITSMGIFGFLSKAHIDQTANAGDNTLQIQQFDQKISREQKKITDAELVTSQLDKTVQILLDAQRLRGKDGAVAVRESQKKEREALNTIITESQQVISKLQEEKLVMTTQQVKLEAEVGPIKYIAEFVYGSSADKNMLEEAVRWVIITIIFVFDPLAVLMLIASQYTFKWARDDKEQNKMIVDSEGTIIGVSPTSNNEVNNEPIYPYPAQQNKTQDIIEPPPQPNAGEAPVEDKAEPVAVEEHVKWPGGIDPALDNQTEESKKKPLESLDLLETQPLTEEEIAREQEYLTKELDSAFQNLKTDWKVKNPDQTLKMWKMLYIKGKIDKLPWEEEIGYKQNSEQSETTLFKKLQERKAK